MNSNCWIHNGLIIQIGYYWFLLLHYCMGVTLFGCLDDGCCNTSTVLAWTTRTKVSSFPSHHKIFQQTNDGKRGGYFIHERHRECHLFLASLRQNNNNNNNGHHHHNNNYYCPTLGGNLVSTQQQHHNQHHLKPSEDVMIPSWEVVPTMNDYHRNNNNNNNGKKATTTTTTTTTSSSNFERLGLEAIVPGAFIVNHVWTPSQCDDIIQTVKYLSSNILNIQVPNMIGNQITQIICPMMDMKYVNTQNENHVEYIPLGINTSWIVYHHQENNILPSINQHNHNNASSNDNKNNNTPRWNVYMNLYTSQSLTTTTTTTITTINIYKQCLHDHNQRNVVASLDLKPGSVLVIPETSIFHVEFVDPSSSTFIQTTIDSTIARQGFHTDDNPLTGVSSPDDEDDDSLLWKYDELVRSTFIPKSTIFSSTFLHHTSNLYNPHMGVENIGILLYSFVRFAKLQNIVEIGAGYTTIYLLQALHDNYEEMTNIQTLQQKDQCRLLNIPWSITPVVDDFLKQNNQISKLRCIDNCLHQRETATGAQAVAKLLGLDSYLQFVQGDVFEDSIHHMLFGESNTINNGGIDLLWCDFGVGSRMKEFASKTWSSIRPGGFLLCHSTLTNTRTRTWLEAIRRHDSQDITGIPPNEYTELSLLEEHKRFQNSITILQKRSNDYSEPIYSEYA